MCFHFESICYFDSGSESSLGAFVFCKNSRDLHVQDPHKMEEAHFHGSCGSNVKQECNEIVMVHSLLIIDRERAHILGSCIGIRYYCSGNKTSLPNVSRVHRPAVVGISLYI